MKKKIFILFSMVLLQSCYVIKIYDTSGNLTKTINDSNKHIIVASDGNSIVKKDKTIIIADGSSKKIRITGSKNVDDTFVFISEADTLVSDSKKKLTAALKNPALADFVWKAAGIEKNEDSKIAVDGKVFKEIKVEANYVDATPEIVKDGVFIVEVDDTATKNSSESKLKIRTDGNNKKPLIVIDGEVQSEEYKLNSISPNQIKSVNVLKGTAASEIYGEKGKNGVVVITLKK